MKQQSQNNTIIMTPILIIYNVKNNRVIAPETKQWSPGALATEYDAIKQLAELQLTKMESFKLKSSIESDDDGDDDLEPSCPVVQPISYNNEMYTIIYEGIDQSGLECLKKILMVQPVEISLELKKRLQMFDEGQYLDEGQYHE